MFSKFIFSQIDLNSDSTTVSDLDRTIILKDKASEEFVVKESLGFSLGVTSSAGLISGAAFTSVPVGLSAVITTPYGFNVGVLRYSVSLVVGGYTGEYNSAEDDDYELPEGGVHWTDEFSPTIVAIGGNLTLSNIVFTEGHVGLVGEGLGARGFAGVSLERLIKNINLPLNVLLGGEGFITSSIAGESASYWGGAGIRLDFNF